jgi:hypothetical protein
MGIISMMTPTMKEINAIRRSFPFSRVSSLSELKHCDVKARPVSRKSSMERSK